MAVPFTPAGAAPVEKPAPPRKAWAARDLERVLTAEVAGANRPVYVAAMIDDGHRASYVGPLDARTLLEIAKGVADDKIPSFRVGSGGGPPLVLGPPAFGPTGAEGIGAEMLALLIKAAGHPPSSKALWLMGMTADEYRREGFGAKLDTPEGGTPPAFRTLTAGEFLAAAAGVPDAAHVHILASHNVPRQTAVCGGSLGSWRMRCARTPADHLMFHRPSGDAAGLGNLSLKLATAPPDAGGRDYLKEFLDGQKGKPAYAAAIDPRQTFWLYGCGTDLPG